MIVDKLKNAHLYYGMGKNIETALKYLENTNLLALDNGKYQIKDDEVYIIVQDYNTKPENEAKLEAHKKYIDIQYIIKGKEKLGYANIDGFIQTTEYSEEKDIIFGDGDISYISAQEGYFLVFTPEDAHAPSVAINQPAYV